MSSPNPTQPQPNSSGCVGILLAAGKGRRFDPAGVRNKLLQVLPNGETVVAQAARHLQAAVGSMLIVAPAGSATLTTHLATLGLTVTECATADTGMAASLTHGLALSAEASAWIIALGDMPFVQPATIERMVAALAQGAGIVAPTYHGKRGNPVGFARHHLPELLKLTGDVGARQLLQRYPVTEIEVDDPGVCQDIDTEADLLGNRDG